jgi:raffinose/stachyose/melibiose transport system permease protein
MEKNIGKIIIYSILIVAAIVSIYPLIWMLLYSFKDNNEIFVTNPFGLPHVWKFENYGNAWGKFDVVTYFRNSMIVAIVTIAFVELFALMFCYVVARVNNKSTRFFHFLISSGMFIPIQAVMIPLVIMVKSFGLTNSFFSIIIPYTALGLPFACMLFYGFYLGLPIELEESSFMDGANLPAIYFKIILPQLKSPIVVLVIYQFMSCWNEFNLALILLTEKSLKTLPLGLVNFWTAYEAQWGEVGAAMIMASLPVLVIYLFFSNQITDAMSASGMKN